MPSPLLARSLLILALAAAACSDSGAGTDPPPPSSVVTTAAAATTTTTTTTTITTVAAPTTPTSTATTGPPPATTGDDLASRAFGVEFATGVTAERVEFSGGSLETSISSAVVRGERAVYFVEAPAGWLLVARIDSLEDNAVFDVYAPTGELLVAEAATGHVLAPEPGDYQIVVGGTRGNATYDLAVALSPAEVVRFDAGTTGTTVAGTALSGTRNAYLLGAAAGQTMTLAATSQEGNAALAVRAPSGEVLEAGVTEAEIVLAESGDYVVLVGGSPGATTFELSITITG